MATGPSINKLNLSQLINKDVYAVSNAHLHADYNKLNIKAHCVLSYHEPLEIASFALWINSIAESLNDGAKLFTSFSNSQFIDEANLQRTSFFKEVKWLPAWGVKSNAPLFMPCSTGSLLPLQMAIKMRYRRIYLVGCDHNTLKNYKSTVLNFYNNAADLRRGATDQLCWGSLQQELNALLNVISQYTRLKKIALSLGIEIINMSDESWIDIFPVV
jgi:hypothetical protein